MIKQIITFLKWWLPRNVRFTLCHMKHFTVIGTQLNIRMGEMTWLQIKMMHEIQAVFAKTNNYLTQEGGHLQPATAWDRRTAFMGDLSCSAVVV